MLRTLRSEVSRRFTGDRSCVSSPPVASSRWPIHVFFDGSSPSSKRERERERDGGRWGKIPQNCLNKFIFTRFCVCVCLLVCEIPLIAYLVDVWTNILKQKPAYCWMEFVSGKRKYFMNLFPSDEWPFGQLTYTPWINQSVVFSFFGINYNSWLVC